MTFSPWPPVTFAWVDSSETIFGPQHERADEQVLDFTMTHSEGNFPTLDVTIKNPYEGLAFSGRKFWVWMAYVKNGSYVPFFFGRQISSPDNIENESITIKFVAKSVHWLRMKQHQADLLKGEPYDPIFVNVNKRADPDVVLEFRSAVWHFDRLPTAGLSGGGEDLQVSISDILDPEDGFITLQSSELFYKNLNWQIGQQPLKSVLMKSDVHWTQYGAGRFSVPSGQVDTWTGGSIVSGWPKPGTSVQGGYTVVSATAFGNAEFATPNQHHITWENTQKTHQEGDTMTLQESWTTYPVSGQKWIFNKAVQAGLVMPAPTWTIPGLPDQFDGVNIPLHVQWSELLVCFWHVNTSLAMDYDAARPRHEKLEFKLVADMQPVFEDIHEPASVNTETVSMSGADVGLPIINTLSWYTLSITGQAVQAGTVVESTPEFIGGPLYAVAINSGGHVGTFEPDWSDVLGAIIVDGGVNWAMIGGNVPIDFPTWRDVSESQVVAGTTIRSQYYLPPPTDIFGTPVPAPPAGTNAFQIALNSGKTSVYSNGLSGLADISPAWPEPKFSTAIGGTTADNQVTWMSLGTGSEAKPVIDIPLGINTGARSYFPKNRGNRSIRALINVARNHLRMRSRVIKITFECKFEKGLDLTCRKGVIAYDHRFPGGVAIGKVTSYTLTMDGDKALPICKVTAEASAGFGAFVGLPSGGQIVIGTTGTGVYALPGYAQAGYQQMIGGTTIASGVNLSSPNEGDVGYTPPLDAPADDGVVFPVTNPSSLIIANRWIVGKPPNAPTYVANATLPVTINLTDPFTGNVTEVTYILPVPNGFTPVIFTEQVIVPYIGPQNVTHIIWYPVTQYYLELKNLTRPFGTQYFLQTTDLQIPAMVNLQAPQQP